MIRSERGDRDSLLMELGEYLHEFHTGIDSVADFGTSGVGSLWTRRSEGTLQLTTEESSRYGKLLHKAHRILAPDEDLSITVVDSALKDAIFAVVDIPGNRTRDAAVRIRNAIDVFRTSIETPGQEYECWIEVEGLDEDSLPAEFGNSRFVTLGDRHLDNLTKAVKKRRSESGAEELDYIDQFIEETIGRPIVVHRAKARDAEAALSLATREVHTTIECLNFFADIIPYNRAYLRIPNGLSGTESSLRIAAASDGSFVYKPETTLPWKYSLNGLRELAHPADVAVKRVEVLRAETYRSDVSELLLRAVRWVGRAAASGRAEDKFLYSMVALECILVPNKSHGVKKSLEARIARIWDLADRDVWADEFGRLYAIRCDLVHDGRLEITEDDTARLHAISLRTVLRLLQSSDNVRVDTLAEWTRYLDKK